MNNWPVLLSDSVWTATLEQFRDRLASLEPVPAGVTAAAVSATFALALLVKVLEVTRKRKDFGGDPARVRTLLEDARNTSQVLARLADDDVAAFQQYLGCVRSKQPVDAAIRKIIEIPLNVARTAAFGITLCDMAAGHVHAVVAPDLGIAAELLACAVRSALLIVNANVQQLPEQDPYRMQVLAEAQRLAI